MATPRDISGSEWFPAKYHGYCVDCDDQVEPGDMVRMTRDGVSSCPPSSTQTAEPHRDERCPTCNLIHAGECF